MEKEGMERDGERVRDEEGWRGHGVVWSEGGRGRRAHSPELIIACVLVITHVLIVCEPQWLFWLVVDHVPHGSWAMVKGACRWVVVAACGQWMLAVLYPPQVIPCGIHGRGDGLQKFQVDSMKWWMESMKWGMDSMEWWMDSMEWWMDSMEFPHGFHPFPHGFHWFSRWIPYGMSSWNHNSTLIQVQT